MVGRVLILLLVLGLLASSCIALPVQARELGEVVVRETKQGIEFLRSKGGKKDKFREIGGTEWRDVPRYKVDDPVELLGRRTATGKVRFLGFNLGDGKKAPRSAFSLDASIGAIHYTDSVGDWQEIDTTATRSLVSGVFTTEWTDLPAVVRMGEDSYRCIYPDRNDLSYYICVGKPFMWMPSPVKDGNTWTWNWAVASMSITVGSGGTKFEYVMLDDRAPSSLTFPVQIVGMTREGATLLRGGNVVMELGHPTAIDAAMKAKEEVGGPLDPISLVVVREDSKVTISLGTEGLVYPIVVDPSDTWQVGADADDCYSYGGDDKTDKLYVYMNYSTVTSLVSAFRFQNVAIAQGSTIDDSYFGGYLGSLAYDDADCHLYAEDVDDGSVPESSDLDTLLLSKTTATYHWQEDSAGLGYQYTPANSFDGIVQEIVSRGGFSSGNSITILGNDTQSAKPLRVYDYEGSSSYGARLYIEYTSGGTVSISNAPSSYGFGTIGTSETTSTGLTHFTITNDGDVTVNITVGGTDMSGSPVTWTLSDTATPGSATYGLKSGLSGGSYNVIVKKDSPYNTLKSGLADSGTQDWGLQHLSPTSGLGSNSVSGTVTLTATQA